MIAWGVGQLVTFTGGFIELEVESQMRDNTCMYNEDAIKKHFHNFRFCACLLLFQEDTKRKGVNLREVIRFY